MKFSIAQAEIYQCLQRIVSIVPPKTTIPILTNILFDLKDNQLQLTGTDLEVSIVTHLNVAGEEDGVAAFPAKKIFDLVRELPDTPLEFTSDQANRLVIKTEKGQFKITGESSDEYPQISTEEQTDQFEYSAERFLKHVDKALFAVSTDELRTTLMGVLLEFRPNELRIVSTDGHRLVKIIDVNFKYEGELKQVIVPVKALNLLSRNMDQSDMLTLGFSPDHVTFKMGTTSIYSKVISGHYPSYDKVIPTSNDLDLIVERDLLSSAVRRSMIFANQHTRQIKWMLSPDSLTIQAEDAEVGGTSQETIPVEYQGEEMEIGYNASYILEIMRHMDSEKVDIKLSDPGSAAIIEPIDRSPGIDIMMLLMPIRLNT